MAFTRTALLFAILAGAAAQVLTVAWILEDIEKQREKERRPDRARA